MPLRIPKYVQIENFRLSMFYRFMQVGIVVPLVLYFFATEQYSMALPLKEHIFIGHSVRGWPNPTVLEQVAKEKTAEPWCKNPSDYNFLGDFLGAYDMLVADFNFVGHRCASVCSSTNSADHCIHPPETWVTDGPGQVLLLTSVRDTLYQKDGSSASKALILPFADFLSVAFKVSYQELDKTLVRFGKLPRESTGTVYTSNDFDLATKFESSCKDPATGVMKTKIIKEIPPGEDLSLTVPELFKLACDEGYLDSIQEGAGTNLHPGAKHMKGALGRIVGAEFTVNVFIKASSPNSNQNSATVKATLNPLSFVGGSSNSFVDINGTSTFRQRQYNGIRVRFVAEGVQTVVDINNVILNISALVVYVTLPIIMIKFFAVYCLGHLSTIYYKVVYSKFNIARECGATATRLMASTQTFHQLEDVTDADGDGIHGDTGISRKVMKAYIKDVLQYRKTVLDENEMQQFVELAFNEVDVEEHDTLDHDPKSYLSIAKSMITDFFDIDAHKGSRSSKNLGPQCINIDEFTNATHSAFPISFESVVTLFDKDRSQSILERMFTPDKLKSALKKAKLTELMKRRSNSMKRDQLLSGDIYSQGIGFQDQEDEEEEEEDESAQGDDVVLRKSADPCVEWR